jgi:hypothetical protein
VHDDPIAQLMRALDRDGKPPLAWVVQWSASGSDPVFAAWSASRSADAMSALLARSAPHLLEAATERLERTLGPGWYHWRGSEIAPVIRAAVPRPPALGELLRLTRP